MYILTSAIVGLALLGLNWVSFSYFLSSIQEKEYRAAVIGGFQFAVFLGILVLFFIFQNLGLFKTPTGFGVLFAMLPAVAAVTWVLFGRYGVNPKAMEGTAGLISGQAKQFDQSEMVISRELFLQPGTETYRKFYEEHPGWEAFDAERRAVLGPMGAMGAVDNLGVIDKPYEAANISASLSAMNFMVYLAEPHMIQPRSMSDNKLKLSPEEATLRVKGFSRMLGADLVGVTRINPLWTYSHRGMPLPGMNEGWGDPLTVKHEYAIVLGTEMDFNLVQTAPHTPNVIETMHNYAEGSSITTRLAQFIANLGYPSNVENVMHYQSLLVPLAVDAGLGELGRHGYLITKRFGSRLRLAAVTTDLPLIPDRPVDIGVRDFCTICEKCADCCPSKSIPGGDPKEYNGTLRWKLNAETCYAYWSKIGTDCSICMRVCPWSHYKSFPHRIITEAVSRNKIARKLFMHMDDLFYGRKPRPKPAPSWAWNQKDV